MINNSIKKQLFGLLLLSGAASAALPPVIDGDGNVLYGLAAPNKMLQMYQRVEQMQSEFQQLQGRLEEQNYLIQSLQKQQRDLYLDTDNRLQQLETGKPSSSFTPTAPAAPKPTRIAPPAAPAQPINRPVVAPRVVAPPQPVTPTNPRPSSPAAQVGQLRIPHDQLAYEKAFSSLKGGRYAEAVEDFSLFTQTYPASSYIPNATYWLAEASYVNRDFDRALAEFNKVITTYPSHSKAKDALLKVGYIQYEKAQWVQARQTLTKVQFNYPGTTVASLAEQRLERMSQENH
ncbi:MAG: hypothetical protein A6F71_05720 [Cycloclasticus sp. symbiont of Poecilosclerida sp. M]|nr:MAG: hypothetical protein A6F71_05720 [Cycloclasticus sp. symbiont of Poecilosclerida sp. M]